MAEEAERKLNLALGLKEAGLEEFAAQVNALHVGEWADQGLFDVDKVEGSWRKAFEQSLTRSINSGGRFYFNLTDLDIAEALNGDPEWWVGRYTAWELQQIVRNASWFANTVFYLDGELLSSEKVKELGIELVITD